MLDRRVLELSRDFLNALAARLAARGIRADQVSWFGFVAGRAAVQRYFENTIGRRPAGARPANRRRR